MIEVRRANEVRSGGQIAFLVTMLACELMLLASLLGGCAATPVGPASDPLPTGDFVMNLAKVSAAADIG